jgi:hypothetical protein
MPIWFHRRPAHYLYLLLSINGASTIFRLSIGPLKTSSGAPLVEFALSSLRVAIVSRGQVNDLPQEFETHPDVKPIQL